MSPTGEESILLISRLMQAHAVEDVLGVATDLLVATSGASAAASFLMKGDGVIAEHWHGAAEPVREQARPSLTSDMHGKRVREMALEGTSMRWHRISSRSFGEHRLFMAALAFDERSPVEPGRIASAELAVEIVAAKLDVERQLSAGRADLAKFKRWLELSNSQMQILDRERQKFAAVVGQSDLLMFVSDEEFVATWTNVALKTRLETLGAGKTSGVEVDEIWRLLGVDCPDSRSPDCPISRVFADGAVAHRESRQRTGNETRILYLTFLPVRAMDGKTAEVLVMIQDLSELDTLRRSESRYRQLFERSPSSMIMASSDTGHILLANLAAIVLTGYSVPELEALTLEDLHEPADWPRARSQYARTIKRDEVRRFDCQLRTKTGRTIVADVTTYRFDLDGQPVTLLDLQDVTRQRRFEAELRLSQLPDEEPED